MTLDEIIDDLEKILEALKSLQGNPSHPDPSTSKKPPLKTNSKGLTKDQEVCWNWFWERYPHRIARKYAIKCFQKKMKTRQKMRDFCLATRIYIRFLEETDTLPMHPSTFINGRWEGYTEEPEILKTGELAKIQKQRAMEKAHNKKNDEYLKELHKPVDHEKNLERVGELLSSLGTIKPNQD